MGEPTFDINIPAQNAADSLGQLAAQTGAIMLFPYALAASKQASAVSGRYTLLQALELLLQGSGLSGGLSDKRVVQIHVANKIVSITEEREMTSNKMSLRRKIGAALASAFVANGAAGQDNAAPQGNAYLEEVVVTGTRRDARSVEDSIAPIDVISANMITNQGDNDLGNLLRTVVPSYNVNAQGTQDGASIVRPANLRGLSPDHTLVLVNGKRLHRAAVITFVGGGLSNGAQGPDIASIPSTALKQVEVLRDGAASQYGSDAIAGVINFILKDANAGGFITAKYGSTYEGDGDAIKIAGNLGLPLGSDGFLNLTTEYIERGATSRSVQRSDAAALIAAGNTAVAKPAQTHGDPEIKEDIKFLANMGVPLSENIELYAVASLTERKSEGSFFFRNPTNRGGIYAGPLVDATTGAADANGVPSVLVGDLSGDTAGDCPAGIPLTQGGGLIPDPTILSQVTDDPNCFSFLQLFPGGFTPSFGGDLEDVIFHVGLTGEVEIGHGLGYDVSFRHGENTVDFKLMNSVNASLGLQTPTTFNAGGYRSGMDVFNADFVYGIPVEPFASDLNVGFGFEHRDEVFEIVPGDAASFALGPFAAPSPAYPLGQGFSTNSNGFAGFSDNSAGKNSQDSSSVYLDLEADVVDALTLQAAVRFEDTEFFGNTTNYKAGALWRLNENARLRTTFSTGFRVPTAGQANVINTTTAFANGTLSDQGTFPLTSPAGQVLADYIAGPVSAGGLGLPRPTLEPESSDNFTIGGSFNVGDLSITIDYFNISLEDRISQSSQIAFVPALRFLASENNVTLVGTTPAAIITELDAAGMLNRSDFSSAENLSSFAFFNNDFQTKTEGIDLVVAGPLFPSGSGETDFSLRLNFTETEVENAGQTISPLRVQELEDGLPEVRGNLAVTHDRGPIRLLGRVNYFGSFFEAHYSDPGLTFNNGSQVTVDAEFGWHMADNWELIVGAQNLFDSYPDDNPFATVLGALYPVTAPGGFNGGFYYVNATFSW